MSHSMVIAIVKPGTDDEIRNQVEQVMAGFDKNMEVPEHPVPCWCVGLIAQEEAAAALEASMGSWDDAKRNFHGTQQEYTEQVYRPRHEFEKAHIAANPKRKLPDPMCETCQATGIKQTTVNDNAKWDWYVIGGRWDGVMCNHPELKGSDDSGDEHKTLQRNMCLVENVKEHPFAFVSFDGSWVERGKWAGGARCLTKSPPKTGMLLASGY